MNEKPKEEPRIKTRAAGIKNRAPSGMMSRVRRPSEDISATEEALGLRSPFPPALVIAPDLTPVDTPVDTTVAEIITPVDAPVAAAALAPASAVAIDERATERGAQLQYLDATHTGSEQKVYSVMYRETISKGIRERHFGNKELCTKTGIRSDKTVRVAVQGLRQKLSIEVVSHSAYFPMGPRYRVHDPKEVARRRRAAGLEIDPQTKKVIAPVVTTVVTTVVTGVDGRGKSYRSDPVISTGVTPVEITGLSKYRNEIVTGETPTALSSSESDARTDDEQDAFVSSVRSVYERLTGNSWTTVDEVTLAEGKDINAVVWGLALCHCIDRAPDHTFSRLAYALEEARRHQEIMGSMPVSDLRGFLRRSVERLERAHISGAWEVKGSAGE